MKNYLAGILFIFGCAFFSYGQSVEDFYTIETINIPKNVELEVGGLAFNDKGQLGVATRRGEIWLLDHPETNTPTYHKFASGLHEALGLIYNNGSFFTAQRSELTELKDTNNNGEADVYRSVFKWELSGNYHEYSFGPVLLPNGDMLVNLNCGFAGGAVSLRKWRGWMLKISPEGNMTPIAAGLRSPAGLVVNQNGDIFYSENQGGWVGSGRVSHVEVGDFMGHPESLRWAQDKKSPVKLKYEDFDLKVTGVTMHERAQTIPEMKLPSVWFPHTIMGISTSGMKVIPDNFGPYTGQIVVGDQGHAKVMRMSQEKVNGVYQGACFPFLKNFQSGVLRLLWSKAGHLYVGMTSRGWGAAKGDLFGLQRVEWSGKTPFDIKHIAVTATGYEIEFTKAVNPKLAEKKSSYSITDFNYNYWSTYGSPIINKENRVIQKVEVLDGAKKVRLHLDKMKLGNIFQIKTTGVKSANNEGLINDVGYYTLNQLPGGKPFTPLVKVNNSNLASTTPKEEKVNLKRITQMPSNWDATEVRTINLTTAPVLKFSKKVIQAKAGEKIKLVFSNPDDMLHNFLLVKPNSADDVVKAAFELGLDGSSQSYVPNIPEVLHHTKLIQPKTQDVIYFKAPSKKGDYTYVCTFPGHGQVMRGIFRVK